MKSQVVQWMQQHQGELEKVMVEAAESYLLVNQHKPNFFYDLRQVEKESLYLYQGGDLCYDRPTIGLSYTLWYLGRRINTSLNFLLDDLLEALQENRPIEIFDLGAGTGAVQIALGFCLEACRNVGINANNSIRLINIDISPFMLDYNHSYLWPAFQTSFPKTNCIRAEYSVNSWINTRDIAFTNPWVVASYLFDHHENREEIAKQFRHLVEQYKPEKLVLLTSNQEKKVAFLNAVSTTIAGKEYGVLPVDNQPVFSGVLQQIAGFRERVNNQHGEVFSYRPPQWGERSFYAKKLIRRMGSLNLFGNLAAADIEEVDLYSSPIKIRREIELNAQQRSAARLNNRPTVITGPAGCGKSVVVTERIKNLCEETDYNENLRILLTTFNKGLMSYLAKWLEDILDKEKIKRSGNHFFFKNNSESDANIRLLHFDLLPTRIGGFQNDLRFDKDHKKFILQAVREILTELEIDPEIFGDLLSPDFLLDEYIRVIYGQQYETLDEYQTGERKGRPFRLDHHSEKRTIIWKTIFNYLKYLEENQIESIFTRRHKLLRSLKRGQYQKMFTHVFVDEFQDCTLADYQIFYGLLKDNNQLVIAGDFAQAVHLGKSARIPRVNDVFQDGGRMGNIATYKLEGSYRLPFRISEAIKPISEYIKLDNEAAELLTPYKGAPPGARPIVVHADSILKMKRKIAWICDYYRAFDAMNWNPPFSKKITILERDWELTRALNDWKNGIAETDTILRLKGLEKECIVWSSRIVIEDSEEVYNFIYTILTRTSSILIIALFDTFPAYVANVLSLLQKERLILWDEETATFYSKILTVRANVV